jgi:hypothetical protein
MKGASSTSWRYIREIFQIFLESPISTLGQDEENEVELIGIA